MPEMTSNVLDDKVVPSWFRREGTLENSLLVFRVDFDKPTEKKDKRYMYICIGNSEGRGVCAVVYLLKYGLDTGMRHFGNIRSISIPIPDTYLCLGRLFYPKYPW